jgi:adenylate kinase
MSLHENELSLQTRLVRNPAGSHNPVISWSGVSGAGKDWLMERVLATLDPQPYRVLSQGSLISELSGVLRDLIRTTLSDKRMRSTRMALLDTLLNGDPTILNSHVLVKHQSRLMVTEKFEKALDPWLYLVVTALPEEIVERRLNRNANGQRISDQETAEQILNHQLKTIKRVDSLTRRNHSGMAVVFNQPSNTEENIQFLHNLLDSFNH